MLNSTFSPSAFGRVVAWCMAVVCGVLAAAHAGAVWSQQAAKSPAPKGYRQLGPGAETTIPAKPDPRDTVTQHDLVEIQSTGPQLNWTPQMSTSSQTLGALTKEIPFRRGAWYLEFSFKPLRVIQVDVPVSGDRMERRTIWYMVYRVRNLGEHLKADTDGGKNEKIAANGPTNEEIYFHPQLVLESQKLNKGYLDRVLPLAVEAIQRREDPNRKLLNSVEMSEQPIPLSKAGEDNSVWGVATWEFVDPRVDFFSVYVKGLSNAYRFQDKPGEYKPGDPPGKGREYAQKTLKLNFWRPGDERDVHEQDIYFGSPGQVDHQWVFR
jgi:hypothetical protein